MSGSDLCNPRSETARLRYFPNRIIMFCLAISTFMYLSAISIPRIGLPILLQPNRQRNECKNWERGFAVSFLGNINRIFDAVQGPARTRRAPVCSWQTGSDGQTPWLNGRPSATYHISDHWSKFRNIVIIRKKFRKGLNQNTGQKPTFGRNIPKVLIFCENI